MPGPSPVEAVMAPPFNTSPSVCFSGGHSPGRPLFLSCPCRLSGDTQQTWAEQGPQQGTNLRVSSSFSHPLPPGCARNSPSLAPARSCPLTRQPPPSDSSFPRTNQFVSTEGRELQSKQIMHVPLHLGHAGGLRTQRDFLPLLLSQGDHRRGENCHAP